MYVSVCGECGVVERGLRERTFWVNVGIARHFDDEDC